MATMPPVALGAITVTIFISLVFTLVFSRDIVWLPQIEQNEAALHRAQVSVAYEVGFIMVVVLALVVNLIISYSRNLKFLFQNETKILEGVTHGDLSQKVPVATNDEFGIIARHTDSMIDGLRHRTELLTGLKLAEEVQQNLLPQQPPDFPGADIAGTSIYCNETGGVHETRNTDGAMFGMNRLRDIISTNAAEPAKHILSSVIQTLRSFQGGAPQEDDITLVVLNDNNRNPGSPSLALRDPKFNPCQKQVVNSNNNGFKFNEIQPVMRIFQKKKVPQGRGADHGKSYPPGG
jgi:hypothetical protein